MDPENLALQERLHQANQDRMQALELRQSEIGKDLSRQGELLAKIFANTECLPKLSERVDLLETSRDKHRGAIALLGIIWTGVSAFYLEHGK